MDRILFFVGGVIFGIYAIFWNSAANNSLTPTWDASQITTCIEKPEWCAEELPRLHEVLTGEQQEERE